MNFDGRVKICWPSDSGRERGGEKSVENGALADKDETVLFEGEDSG